MESICTSSRFRVSNNFTQVNENNYSSFLRILFCGGRRIIYLKVCEGLWNECNQWLTSYTLQNACTNNDAKRYKYNVVLHIFFFLWRCDPTWVMASSFLRFIDHTQRRTTDGRTPLDEWSALRRYLFLTTHNSHNRQTYMTLAGFEHSIPVSERPQTHAIDRAFTGTSMLIYR